jgi:hypothetical protein
MTSVLVVGVRCQLERELQRQSAVLGVAKGGTVLARGPRRVAPSCTSPTHLDRLVPLRASGCITRSARRDRNLAVSRSSEKAFVL